MVMIKRRSGTASTTPRELSKLDDRSSSSSLPFGDFRDSPKYTRASSSSSFNVKAFKNSLNKPAHLPSWAIKCFVGLIVASWCLALYWNSQLRSELKVLEMEHQIEMLHYEEANKSLKEASKSQKLMEREIQKLEKTKKALEHEIRMASELKEGETLGASHHYDIAEGIENRHEVLKEKIATLRSYIQEESHREVLEK
jgi:uncharacterized protein HemX